LRSCYLNESYRSIGYELIVVDVHRVTRLEQGRGRRHRGRQGDAGEPGIGVTQIAHGLGISPATLYRYIPTARTANTPGV
jgi:hypothetical protein